MCVCVCVDRNTSFMKSLINVCCGDRRRFVSYVFLEDEAGQEGGGLLHRQVVEEAVEDHLRQQQLVSTGADNETELITS